MPEAREGSLVGQCIAGLMDIGAEHLLLLPVHFKTAIVQQVFHRQMCWWARPKQHA